MSNLLLPYGLSPTSLPSPWYFPGKNTRAGCQALLQGIFQTQGSNPCLLCLLHCRKVLYQWTTREAQISTLQFSSVQLLSHVWLFATPWMAACQASLSITNSRSPLKPMSIQSVMPSSHLILCSPFSSCVQSLPASGSFPMSQHFAWGGRSTGVSASASVLPMNTQDWSLLGWTGWISLQSKGLSRVFSNTTVQKHQFSGTQHSSQSNSHIHTWPLEKP